MTGYRAKRGTQSGPNLAFPGPLQCLFQKKRFKVLWGGRGAGRSWGCARALLVIGREKATRILCVREYQNSIDDSVYKVLKDQIEALGWGNFYDVQKTKIYGANGTEFNFEGIRNNVNRIKSYEGIDICWVEEAAKARKNSWGVLIPTIRKEDSEIWLTFNPELETDYTYQRFVKDPSLSPVGPRRFEEPLGSSIMLESESSFVCKMTYKDNPWFPEVLKKDMQADKERDYDYYLNVWEGHCLQILEGVVYAKELRKAAEEGRIATVPWSELYLWIHTGIWARGIAHQSGLCNKWQCRFAYWIITRLPGRMWSTLWMCFRIDTMSMGCMYCRSTRNMKSSGCGKP